MATGAPRSFGAQLKALREAAGFTQEELATIAGLSVHAVSALERGERRRPQVETVRALSAALDLTGAVRDALVKSARAPAQQDASGEVGLDSLPLAPTALIGREPDLLVLQQWLADPAVRLITLIGPGGVGKTRLAIEVLRGIAPGSTRVAIVALAAIQNSAFVAPAIAEALGLADVAAIDLPGRARAACSNRPTLLLLDNFEHVIEEAPLVSDLLRSVTSLRLLVTSRAPLRLRGEREYTVGPLELQAVSSGTADVARAPAVRLFVERVRDVQPDFHLTPENAVAVAAICRRLDALPLALELAAPWIKVLTTEDLLRRLEDNVLLSMASPRDLPARQQTMNATVAWSYQLLDPNEQRAFRRLGALPAHFPIGAAAAVLAGREDAPAAQDDALRTVAGLMDKSLLQRAETPVTTCPTYYMLETVRAYAARELAASGERDAAVEGLVRYCTAQAARAAAGLVGPSQGEWLDWVFEDLESYRTALTSLIQAERSAEASDIASALEFFWVIRGHTTEGLEWYRQILGLPSVAPAAELQALIGAAMLWFSQGELEQARTALTRAVALAHDLHNAQKLAQAEYVFGHVELAAGNIGPARELFDRSLDQFRSLAIPWGIGSALTGLAWVALSAGEAKRAERLLEEARAPLRHAGPWFLGLVRYLHAILAVRQGDADAAIAVTRESLTQIRELRDRFAFVYALVPLATAAVMKGDDAWAARILGARDAVTERTGARIVDGSVDDLRQQANRDARARLGSDRWATEYEAGRSMSIDSLLMDIDRVT